jgi:hypothetical protein
VITKNEIGPQIWYYLRLHGVSPAVIDRGHLRILVVYTTLWQYHFVAFDGGLSRCP